MFLFSAFSKAKHVGCVKQKLHKSYAFSQFIFFSKDELSNFFSTSTEVLLDLTDKDTEKKANTLILLDESFPFYACCMCVFVHNAFWMNKLPYYLGCLLAFIRSLLKLLHLCWYGMCNCMKCRKVISNVTSHSRLVFTHTHIHSCVYVQSLLLIHSCTLFCVHYFLLFFCLALLLSFFSYFVFAISGPLLISTQAAFFHNISFFAHMYIQIWEW